MVKKFFTGLIFVILLGLASLAVFASVTKKSIADIFPFLAQVSRVNSSNQDQSATTTQNKITLLFAGDIMLDRGVEQQIQIHNNWEWPFLKIASTTESANIAFANLEGPISDKGTKVGSIYSFRDNPKAMSGLTLAGFDVVSVANNHSFDYGRAALEDMFSRLKTAGIDYTGGGFNATEAATPVTKEVKGTTFAFLAYTNLCPSSWKPTADSSGINCISSNDLPKVKEAVENAKKDADIVIVSLHSGIEYSQTITQFQKNFAHAAIDAGADLVIGHHPHVVQKSEQYKGKWIFYSLGNFVFDQNFSTDTMQGLMVNVTVENKKIINVTPIKTQLNDSFQVELASAATKPSTIIPLSSAARTETQELIPSISLSSSNPLQGNTILITVNGVANTKDFSATFNSKPIAFFSSGGKVFGLIGIDAKMAPGNYKINFKFSDNSKIEKTITVVKKNFPVTVLAFTPELESKGYNATSVASNNYDDSSKLYAAMAKSSPAPYFNKSFFYPLDKIINVGAFGNIRQSGSTSLQHLGTDLEAAMDSNVYAVNNGVVTGTLNLIDYGNTIVIDHGGGIFSLYLHLDKFKVSVGQKVTRGQIIGLSGETGYALAPHLHFSIKLNGASVDPIKFIQTAQF